MNVVFMGTPDFAVPTLKKLIGAGHCVRCVFTQPDKPKGRGYKLLPSPVKVLAQENGIPVYQPASLRKDADEFIKVIKDSAPDVIVVAAYGKILPKEVLDIPRLGCVNVHGSLLPKYRGAAPIQWSVINGDQQTGVTTMLMAEGLDTGDILLKSSVTIGENETSSELFERLAVLGAELLEKTLDGLEQGSISPEKQDGSLASYAPMLTKDMCLIDFSEDTFKVHKKICGLSESPCAYTFIDGKRLKVYRSEMVSGDVSGAEPGEVVNEKQLIVACKDGLLKLCEIQAEGSKRMAAADYLRGKPVEKGIVLGH